MSEQTKAASIERAAVEEGRWDGKDLFGGKL